MQFRHGFTSSVIFLFLLLSLSYFGNDKCTVDNTSIQCIYAEILGSNYSNCNENYTIIFASPWRHLLLKDNPSPIFFLRPTVWREVTTPQRIKDTYRIAKLSANFSLKRGFSEAISNKSQTFSTWIAKDVRPSLNICIYTNDYTIPRDYVNNASFIKNTRRIKRFRRPCSYYANSVACLRIQRLTCSGDIEVNPGPRQMHKCHECEKTIRKNQKETNCTSCLDLFHVKCIASTTDIKTIISNYICSRCLWTELPYHYIQNDSFSLEAGQSSSTDSDTLDLNKHLINHMISLTTRPNT